MRDLIGDLCRDMAHEATLTLVHHAVYGAQTLTQELYPEMINTLRELAGGALIMLPSSAADFGNPEMTDIIKSVQISADGKPETERVKLMKLAWDLIGSEFAGRHEQYEKFYAGAPFIVKTHAHRTYDWSKATDLVDYALSGYDIDGRKF